MAAALAWLAALELAGALVFGLAMFFEMCLRRSCAATRRGVWALAISVALALPFTRLALDAPAAVVGPRIAAGLLVVWTVGAAGLLMRLGLGVARARRLRGMSELLERDEWSASMRALGASAELRVSDELRAPAVIGVWRPAIVVPREMLGLSATERRSLLAHELAHVARADGLLRGAGAVVRAIFWVCPLAWTALRRLRVLAEEAADDAVLHAGVPSSSYAAQLVAVARAQLERAGRVAAGGLKARVTAVLDSRRVRGPARARWGLTRMVGAALLLASLVTACEARQSEVVVVVPR